MTRAEAIDKVKQTYPYGICMQNEDLINEIYNSFENQKCKNCKYMFQYPSDTEYKMRCHNDVYIERLPNSPNFSCNKWESNVK